MQVVDQFEYVSDKDRRKREQSMITQIPKTLCVNRVRAYVDPPVNIAGVSVQDVQEIHSSTDLPIVIETVKACNNCHRVVSDINTSQCEQCLESIRKSKKRRAEIALPDDKQFCPRCSCVRDKTDFNKEGANMPYKSCKKCRERNTKTTQYIKEHNSDKPAQKLCTTCHKQNDLESALCGICLEKKRTNRKRCEHDRIYDQCGEGDCINNARNICKVHRVRFPCKKCIA